MDLTSFIKSQNFRNTMNSQPGIMGNLSGGNLPSFGMGGGGNTPGVNLPGGNLPSFGMGGGGNALSTNPFGLANTMTPNTNQGGFARGIGGALSNIGGFVQNNQRFGDALAGAAILGGTPIADAFAVRETINPTTDTIGKSVGSIYNVKNLTTNRLTGEQVFSTDRKRMDEIAANTNLELVTPADGSTITSDGKEFADVQKGQVRFEDADGNVVTKFEDTSPQAADIRDEILTAQKEYDGLIKLTQEQIGDIDEIISIRQDFDTATSFAKYIEAQQRLGLAGQASDAARKLDQIGTNVFINKINEMRAASKTGGAVGQVTEKEMAAFRNSEYDLDVYNTTLIEELTRARNDYENYLNTKTVNIQSAIDNYNKQLITQVNFDDRGFTSYDDELAKSILNLTGGGA